MNLPKELTTVTPLSKIIALIMFITLPIIAFLFGMKYESLLNVNKNNQLSDQIILNSPSPTKSQTSPIPTITSALKSTQITNWKTFTNNKLGFSFQYPTIWGEIKENIEEIIPIPNTAGGKQYSLSFSNVTMNYETNDVIFGVGQSSDSFAARGGMDTDYKGDPNKAKGVTGTIYARPTSCIIPYSAHLFFGWIDFNLPGKEIGGIRLILPILSKNDIRKMDQEYNLRTEKEKAELCVWEKVAINAKEYINEIKDKIDDESTRNILIYEKVLNSAQVF